MNATTKDRERERLLVRQRRGRERVLESGDLSVVHPNLPEAKIRLATLIRTRRINVAQANICHRGRGVRHNPDPEEKESEEDGRWSRDRV